MKAITFLGFNPKGYQKTIYVHPDGHAEKETEFIQEALVELYHPQTLYVLLTHTAETRKPDGAQGSAWETLQHRLEGKVDLQPIKNVPESHSAADLWTLFDQLTG